MSSYKHWKLDLAQTHANFTNRERFGIPRISPSWMALRFLKLWHSKQKTETRVSKIMAPSVNHVMSEMAFLDYMNWIMFYVQRAENKMHSKSNEAKVLIHLRTILSWKLLTISKERGTTALAFFGEQKIVHQQTDVWWIDLV